MEEKLKNTYSLDLSKAKERSVDYSDLLEKKNKDDAILYAKHLKVQEARQIHIVSGYADPILLADEVKLEKKLRLENVEYCHDMVFKYSDAVFGYSKSVNQIYDKYGDLYHDEVDSLLEIREKENNSFKRRNFSWLMSKRRVGSNVNVLIDDEVNKLKDFESKFVPASKLPKYEDPMDSMPAGREYGNFNYI